MKKEDFQQPFNPENISEKNECLNSGKGDFSFNGNLRISGFFSGKLKVGGILTIGADSRLIGEVVANDLILYGQMVGTANVSGMFVLHASSLFSGTLIANEAEIYSGCSISGKRTIGRTTEIEALKSFKSSKYNIEDAPSIPDEMTYNRFNL